MSKARTLPGFMELLPQEQLIMSQMTETIRQTYELFGFTPLDTPVLEASEVLLSKSGGETEKQIYAFKKGDNELAMRFDLTVPLAKYVALYNNDLSFPFKRYQIGKVYRGERPQKGRFREFYQCDIDIIDRDELNIVYDAEILAVIYNVFRRLNLSNFTIVINNRKLLSGFMESLNIAEKTTDVLRIVDKIKKISEADFMACLEDLQLDKNVIAKILDFIRIKGSNTEILRALKALPIDNDNYRQGLEELETVVDKARKFGMPEENLKIDLSITRGLDYYTGTGYETFFNDHPEFGSVCSGGRYDNLSSVFMDKKFPGVGISIGLTRLFDQLRSHQMIECGALTPNRALIILQDSSFIDAAIGLCADLRGAGINCDIFHKDVKFKAKMNYANKIGVPFVIIIGEDEVKNGKYTVKNMSSGEQQQLASEDLIAWVK